MFWKNFGRNNNSCREERTKKEALEEYSVSVYSESQGH